MKRLHIHVNTSEELFVDTVGFYKNLFNASPSKEKPFYSKWMLEDPKVNFVLEVVNKNEANAGVHHLGLQVDNNTEIDHIKASLSAAKIPMLDVGKTQCCYSESEKMWTQDPLGLKWETFMTSADIEEYGAKSEAELSACKASS